eukprot:480870_1
MSNTSTEYKKLIAARLVPLYAVHPIIYNFGMNLICTVLNLKQEIVESMKKHNHRIKILLNAYLKQIETMLSPNNHIHLFVIPTEIIDMCGKFYDEYYPMTIDIKVENLAVFPRNNDRLLQNEASLQHWSHSNDKFCVYELMNDTMVTNYFMSDLNATQKEFTAVPIVNILRDIHYSYKEDEVMLVAKLPIRHAIDSNVIKRIVTDTIRSYMKESNDNDEPFAICLGDYSVNAMSAICVFLNSCVSDTICRAKIKYFMENEEVPQNLEEYTLEIGRYIPNIAHTISVIWTIESYRLFKSDVFAKCEDTWNNHVCAMELFEDDDIPSIFD